LFDHRFSFRISPGNIREVIDPRINHTAGFAPCAWTQDSSSLDVDVDSMHEDITLAYVPLTQPWRNSLEPKAATD